MANWKTNTETRNRFRVRTGRKEGMKPRVSRIRIIREVDESPDLSYLGEFSMEPEGPFAIDRFPDSDYRRPAGEYRYFNPENVENAEQAQQNYSRMMEYNTGNIVDYFVRAEAEVLVPIPNMPGNFQIQRIHSGGLGGVQSDSDASYLKEIEDEQLDDLMTQLKAFGIHKNLNAPIERDFE